MNSLKAMLPESLIMIVKALLILLLAYIVADIAKKLVLKLLGKVNVGKSVPEDEKKSINTFIGKFVYLFVFLLFVPAIFDTLKISSVTSPIRSILDSVWGYLPNIIAAAIVLVVGFMVAKLVRQLLIPVFDKLNINKLQEKLGIEAKGYARLSQTLAYIVYVLILIPVIITALDALKIAAISDPAVGVLDKLISTLPGIITGIIIIALGVVLAKFVAQIVERLIAVSGLDAKLSKVIEKNNFVLSKTVGLVVQVVITIFFVVEGVNALKLPVLSAVGAAIIGYMPNVLAAALIVAIALFAASVAGKLFLKNAAPVYKIIVKSAIITIGVFMMLNQLGIATQIVNAAFIIILLALAVAFAVAFGVGGRTFAAHVLEKLEKKIDEK